MTDSLTSTSNNSMQPPMYRGDLEGSLKELGPTQLEILQLQLAEHARLNELELHSELRDRFASGDTRLPAGTLLHGTSYEPETIASIAANGVMSGDLFGVSEDGETFYCADFFRATEDTTIADYTEWISGNEPTTDSRFKRPRMEASRLPSRKRGNEQFGVIIDAAIPEIQPLLEADAYRPKTDKLFEGIVKHLPREKGSPEAERISAILGGIPKGAIAGILVNERLAENAEHVADIRANFGADIPIIGVDGQLIDEAKEADEPAEIMLKKKTLYHGSASADIGLFNPAEENTVGKGIYFVDNPEDAAGYARRSSNRDKTPPVVYETEIDDAKIVNLDNPEKLQEVMRGFAVALSKQDISEFDWSYQGAFKHAIESAKKGTVPGRVKRVTEAVGRFFSDYLKDQGYDGLKTLEGGEGNWVGNHTTYVIFDPEKVKIKGQHPVGEDSAKIGGVAIDGVKTSNEGNA